jgi:hypothetical protein
VHPLPVAAIALTALNDHLLKQRHLLPAAGAAFSPGEWTKARTGLQLTPLLGPFYGRLQWLLDGGMALEFGVAIKFPVLFLFGG